MVYSLEILRKQGYKGKIKFGGNMLEGAMTLANLLKRDCEERHFKARLAEASRVFNNQELEYGLHGKLPVAKKNDLFQLSGTGRFIVQDTSLGRSMFRGP